MDLKQLHREYGQSVWLDYIRRDLLQSGEFARLVKEDGIRGVTSNPSIFEKAIAESTDYGSALERLVKSKDTTASAIYEHLAVEDLQQAADILRSVYDESDRRDGYVSMEVSPYLAHDTRATIDEATRLWRKVGRDNLMIKVPGTPEGIPAIWELTSQGINVNVTLLFSRAACGRVNEAYMDGLEALATHGGDPARVASVASMFVSRLDALVDPMLEERALAAPGGWRWLHGAHARSASYGRAPAPRTRASATSCTSSRSSAPTQSTPFRSPRSMPCATTARRRAASKKTSATPGRSWRRSRAATSRSTT